MVGGGGGGELHTDMNALPQQEMGLRFKLSVQNVMHACGQELHSAVVRGIAKVLRAHASEIEGTTQLLS